MSYVIFFAAFIIIFPPKHEGMDVNAGMVCDVNHCYEINVQRDKWGNISPETLEELEELWAM